MNAAVIRYAFILVFIFGFLVNSQPVLLSVIKSELTLSNTQVGMIFMVGAINGIVSALLAGYLLEIRGFRFAVRWSLVMVVTGSMMYGLPCRYFSYGIVLVASFIFMMGLSGCFIVGNSMIAAVCSEDKTKYLNYTHLFYCIGSLISPVVMTGFHRLIPPLTAYPLLEIWRLNFGINPLLACICLVYGWRLDFPETQSLEPFSLEVVKEVLRHPAIYIFTAVLATYIVADLSLCNWIVLYLKWSGRTVTAASMYLTGYFILMALGRFSGALLLTEKNTDLIMLMCLALVPVFLLAGYHVHALLLPVSGLFFSIVFPTMLGKVYHEIRYKPFFSVGVIMTGMSVSYSISQALIGKLNDLYSIGTVLPAVTVGCSLASLVGFLVYCFRKRRPEN